MFIKLRNKIKHIKLVNLREATQAELDAELLRVEQRFNMFVNADGTDVFVEWLELQIEKLRDDLELYCCAKRFDKDLIRFTAAKLEVYREQVERINEVFEDRKFAAYEEEEVEDSQTSYVNSPA